MVLPVCPRRIPAAPNRLHLQRYTCRRIPNCARCRSKKCHTCRLCVRRCSCHRQHVPPARGAVAPAWPSVQQWCGASSSSASGPTACAPVTGESCAAAATTRSPTAAATPPTQGCSCTRERMVEPVELQVQFINLVLSRLIFFTWYTVLIVAFVIDMIPAVQWSMDNICGTNVSVNVRHATRWSSPCVTLTSETVPPQVYWTGPASPTLLSRLVRFSRIAVSLPTPVNMTSDKVRYLVQTRVTLVGNKYEEEFDYPTRITCNANRPRCQLFRVPLDALFDDTLLTARFTLLDAPEAMREAIASRPSAVGIAFQRRSYTIAVMILRYLFLLFSICHTVWFIAHWHFTNHMYEQRWVMIMQCTLFWYLNPLNAVVFSSRPLSSVLAFIEYRIPAFMGAVIVGFMFAIIVTSMPSSSSSSCSSCCDSCDDKPSSGAGNGATEQRCGAVVAGGGGGGGRRRRHGVNWLCRQVHPHDAPLWSKLVSVLYVLGMGLYIILGAALTQSWQSASNSNTPNAEFWVLYGLLLAGAVVCLVMLVLLRHRLALRPYLESRPQQLAFRMFISLFIGVVIYTVVHYIIFTIYYNQQRPALYSYQPLIQLQIYLAITTFVNILTFAYTRVSFRNRVPVRADDARWRHMVWPHAWYRWLAGHGGSHYIFFTEQEEMDFYSLQYEFRQRRWSGAAREPPPPPPMGTPPPTTAATAATNNTNPPLSAQLQDAFVGACYANRMPFASSTCSARRDAAAPRRLTAAQRRQQTILCYTAGQSQRYLHFVWRELAARRVMMPMDPCSAVNSMPHNGPQRCAAPPAAHNAALTAHDVPFSCTSDTVHGARRVPPCPHTSSCTITTEPINYRLPRLDGLVADDAAAAIGMHGLHRSSVCNVEPTARIPPVCLSCPCHMPDCNNEGPACAASVLPGEPIHNPVEAVHAGAVASSEQHGMKTTGGNGHCLAHDGGMSAFRVPEQCVCAVSMGEGRTWVDMCEESCHGVRCGNGMTACTVARAEHVCAGSLPERGSRSVVSPACAMPRVGQPCLRSSSLPPLLSTCQPCDTRRRRSCCLIHLWHRLLRGVAVLLRVLHHIFIVTPRRLMRHCHCGVLDPSYNPFHTLDYLPFFNVETAIDCLNLSWEAYATAVHNPSHDAPDNQPPVMCVASSSSPYAGETHAANACPAAMHESCMPPTMSAKPPHHFGGLAMLMGSLCTVLGGCIDACCCRRLPGLKNQRDADYTAYAQAYERAACASDVEALTDDAYHQPSSTYPLAATTTTTTATATAAGAGHALPEEECCGGSCPGQRVLPTSPPPCVTSPVSPSNASTHSSSWYDAAAVPGKTNSGGVREMNMERYGYTTVMVHEAAAVQMTMSTMNLQTPQHAHKASRVMIAFRGTANRLNMRYDVHFVRVPWTEMMHAEQRQEVYELCTRQGPCGTHGGVGRRRRRTETHSDECCGCWCCSAALCCPPCRLCGCCLPEHRKPTVHSGFLAVWKAHQGVVMRQLYEVLMRDRQTCYRVFTTGHSLGGAVASLCAYSVTRMLLAMDYPVPECTVYTFGQPRLGNQRFQHYYNRAVPRTFCVMNESDVVMSLNGLGAHHVGIEVDIDRNGNYVVNPNIVERLLRPTRGRGFSVAHHHLRSYAISLNALSANTACTARAYRPYRKTPPIVAEHLDGTQI